MKESYIYQFRINYSDITNPNDPRGVVSYNLPFLNGIYDVKILSIWGTSVSSAQQSPLLLQSDELNFQKINWSNLTAPINNNVVKGLFFYARYKKLTYNNGKYYSSFSFNQDDDDLENGIILNDQLLYGTITLKVLNTNSSNSASSGLIFTTPPYAFASGNYIIITMKFTKK